MDDDISEIITDTITIKEQQEFSLDNFKKAFDYNSKYGKKPKQVDYIIYPYNKKAYKWTIIIT